MRTRPNPTKAEVDRVARQLLADVPEPPRGQSVINQVQINGKSFDVTRYQPLLDWGPLFEAAIRQRVAADRQRAEDRQRANLRLRTYPDGCTCPKLPANGVPQTYDLTCPIQGHQRLALAARHRKC